MSKRTLESTSKWLFLLNKIVNNVLVTGSYTYPEHTSKLSSVGRSWLFTSKTSCH
jgi:hypothetical protein